MVNGALHHAVPEPRYRDRARGVGGGRLAAVQLMKEKLEGESCQVNSRHHQAVKDVAPGWEVRDRARRRHRGDRAAGQVFRLAVQWHPENFFRTGEFRPLFEGFIEAASEAAERAQPPEQGLSICCIARTGDVRSFAKTKWQALRQECVDPDRGSAVVERTRAARRHLSRARLRAATGGAIGRNRRARDEADPRKPPHGCRTID